MKFITGSAVLMPAVLSISFIVRTPAKDFTKTGKEIFEYNCARCHGPDGTKGRWGAKNLKTSVLADPDLFRIISNGKRIMPAWKRSLTENEIELVRDYIKTLRK